MTQKHLVTLIKGDGVGPEVTQSVCELFKAANAPVDWNIKEAGKKSFLAGIDTGLPIETIESIQKTGLVLKGPLETPVGFGGKSANVTLRKLFDTFANIRPARIMPGLKSRYSDEDIDLILVRENVEGLYTGVEHWTSPQDAQSLKILSRAGCERIARFAFECARTRSRKKVTCATKANIMKITQGLLKQICEEVAVDYPDVTYEHILIDNCAHQLVINPSQFDVLVMTNLNGDILSDLCSGLVGGLGFAPSANIGFNAAIFEAVHGSAPNIAGQNSVNPTSLILSSLLLLEHIGAHQIAYTLRRALEQTFMDGIFTADVPYAKHTVSTTEFTQSIIENLHNLPEDLTQKVPPKAINLNAVKPSLPTPAPMTETGLDLTLIYSGQPETLGCHLKELLEPTSFELVNIANRGFQVYPKPPMIPDLTDSYQCRLSFKGTGPIPQEQITTLLKAVMPHYSWSKILKLFSRDSERCYSIVQGGSD